MLLVLLLVFLLIISLKEKSAGIMDMSRYAQYLQQPARYLEPVLPALRSVWQENDSLRRQRLLRFKLLRPSAFESLIS